MRRLFASIAAMMLVLTLVSGVQASPAVAETGGCASTVVADGAPGHSAGDADEVPADSDKATPHHHNISHSHEMAVPATELAAIGYTPVRLPVGTAATAPPASMHPARNLRPPIA